MDMMLAEKIKTATLEDAQLWNVTDEKFTFCIDWLEISASHRLADLMVEKLETELLYLLLK